MQRNLTEAGWWILQVSGIAFCAQMRPAPSIGTSGKWAVKESAAEQRHA